jgi:hypothetical protein
MPWRGFEPRRLSAPPPQDGVSTSFTTRAKTTGPTGLEPATSRVTVECSNQTELRPLCLNRGSCGALHRHRIRSPAHTACHRGSQLTNSPTHVVSPSAASRRHSPYGSRTRLCTVKGCRPEPIDERATCNSGNGIRTRVPALRGLCPSPLDDTAACPSPSPSQTTLSLFHAGPEGIEPPTAGFGDRCSTN